MLCLGSFKSAMGLSPSVRAAVTNTALVGILSSGHSFLPMAKAAESVPGETRATSWFADGAFLLCSHITKGTRKLSGVSLEGH